MTSPAIADLLARIQTNTLTATQQAALGHALTILEDDFPEPDEISNSIDDVRQARTWIAALYAIQAEGVGPVPAAPVGTLIVATIADLEALPNATLLVGQPAIVQSVGAAWALSGSSTLAVDGITVVAGLDGRRWQRGATLVAELAAAQAAWFVDATAGNDEHTGLSSGQALQTKAEIARRWGSWSPVLDGITVTITYLSDDTDGSDPGLYAPTLKNGAILYHTAPLPAAQLDRDAQRRHRAKTAPTKTPLSSTVTTATGALAADMLLVNATAATRARSCAEDLGGGNWQIDAPFTPFVVGGLGSRRRTMAWAHDDAVSAYVGLGGPRDRRRHRGGNSTPPRPVRRSTSCRACRFSRRTSQRTTRAFSTATRSRSLVDVICQRDVTWNEPGIASLLRGLAKHRL